MREVRKTSRRGHNFLAASNVFFLLTFHTHTHTHIWDMQVRFMYKACLFTLVLTPRALCFCQNCHCGPAAAALACLPCLNNRLLDALADVQSVSTFASPVFCVIQSNPRTTRSVKLGDSWTPIQNVNACTTTLCIRSMHLAT